MLNYVLEGLDPSAAAAEGNGSGNANGTQPLALEDDGNQPRGALLLSGRYSS